jgi:hypothetical protein
MLTPFVWVLVGVFSRLVVASNASAVRARAATPAEDTKGRRKEGQFQLCVLCVFVVKSIRGHWKCFTNSILHGRNSGSYYHTLEHEDEHEHYKDEAGLVGEERLTNGFVWITVTHSDRIDGKRLAIQRIVSYRDYSTDTRSALGFLESGKRDH